MTITNYTLIIYPMMFLIIYLGTCRIYKRKESSVEFLPLTQTKIVQGLACLGVVIHHFVQNITSYGELNKGPITIFNSMGIIFTAIFFFFSGYGLMVSMDKKDHYLDNFLLHRIPVVLVPFWVINVAYVIYRNVPGVHAMKIGQLINFIFGLRLINSNGWFIIEIVCLYLAFYVFFKFIKNKDVALILLIFFSLALIAYSKHLGHDNDLIYPSSRWFMGEWWYNSTIAFPMGLLFGRFRKRIFPALHKYYMIFLPILVLTLVFVFRQEESVRKVYGYYSDSYLTGGMLNSTRTLLAQMLLVVISTFTAVMIFMKLNSKSRVLTFAGKISMEIFLVHHLVMDIVFSRVKGNDVLRLGLILTISCIVAYIFSLINGGILKLINILTSNCRRKKTVSQDNITLEKSLHTKMMRRKMIRLILVVIVIFIIFVTYKLFAGRILFARHDVKEELQMLKEAQVGDEVLWGRFDTDIAPFKERVSWIVISKSGSRCTLICKYGIDSFTYNRVHESVSWLDSSLRERLRSDRYTEMFSAYELEYMLTDGCGDVISIPTRSQVEQLDVRQRMLTCTQVALGEGANANIMSKVNGWDYRDEKASWWWIRPDNANERILIASIVNVDGEIEFDGRYVNKPNGAIRPIITIRIEQ